MATPRPRKAFQRRQRSLGTLKRPTETTPPERPPAHGRHVFRLTPGEVRGNLQSGIHQVNIENAPVEIPRIKGAGTKTVTIPDEPVRMPALKPRGSQVFEIRHAKPAQARGPVKALTGYELKKKEQGLLAASARKITRLVRLERTKGLTPGLAIEKMKLEQALQSTPWFEIENLSGQFHQKDMELLREKHQAPVSYGPQPIHLGRASGEAREVTRTIKTGGLKRTITSYKPYEPSRHLTGYQVKKARERMLQPSLRKIKRFIKLEKTNTDPATRAILRKAGPLALMAISQESRRLYEMVKGLKPEQLGEFAKQLHDEDARLLKNLANKKTRSSRKDYNPERY